ncbi:peptidoglycan-binding protein [Actinoplanes italicus]|uniref:Multidrug efflux pump subunit AcrA (Membrane-fusion protein) n=1 Tax=Actinoplanes italicus TaxID=113567 RepID=A0A2T0JWI9_9ACTN|nr:peptidoglycan-binding protein [Actinoplanes italicus]PRX12056.1 multidrug efflux pump subunit AcrA (membrane-fusion protein) [Actinoplanes italicus]GIE30873.1 peptidoglycan-binding protein [Actinoplanes italicus]
MTRRTRWLLAGTLVTAGIAAAVVAVLHGAGSEEPPPAAGPGATTTVRRQTLAASVTVDGELGYGEPVPLRSSASGTVTWLPRSGRVIRRGGTLLRADNRPVVLLTGVLPVYRPLSPGVEGPDVLQLERNLRALGHDGFTVDDEYSDATAQVVRRWQRKLGLPQTGTVDTSWVTVAAGPVRIAELKVRVGDPATGTFATYTGETSVVTVDAEADAAGWAAPGTKVTVLLPNGRRTAGTVTHVGAEAVAAEGKDPTVPVTVRLGDPKAAGGLRAGPVEVTYTGKQRKDVLTVPVAALLALAEGGYGLQVVEGGATRDVAVEVGMFAEGRAEVSGGGLADGTVVGMPS